MKYCKTKHTEWWIYCKINKWLITTSDNDMPIETRIHIFLIKSYSNNLRKSIRYTKRLELQTYLCISLNVWRTWSSRYQSSTKYTKQPRTRWDYNGKCFVYLHKWWPVLCSPGMKHENLYKHVSIIVIVVNLWF